MPRLRSQEVGLLLQDDEPWSATHEARELACDWGASRGNFSLEKEQRKSSATFRKVIKLIAQGGQTAAKAR
jgi:hypothetical protein